MRNNYVPIDREALIAVLTAEAKARKTRESKLMKRIGVAATLLSTLRHTKSQRYLKAPTFKRLVAFGLDPSLFARAEAAPNGAIPSLTPATHDRPRARAQTQNGHPATSLPSTDLDTTIGEGVAAAFLLGRITEIISHHAEGVGLSPTVLANRVGEMLRRPSRR